MDLDKLLLIRDAGAVKRYHTVRTLSDQTIAAHSWGVAQILMEIAPLPLSKELLVAALNHDVPEICTGDLPAPVKWENPVLGDELDIIESRWCQTNSVEFPDLDPMEEMYLKIADTLELILHCCEEAGMGNVYMLEIARRGMEFLKGKYLLDEAVKQLVEQVDDMISELEVRHGV